MCCDALVLSCLKPDPRTYASSLLNAVELLTSPALRPPAMASEIDSGGFLERRLRMIISNKLSLTTPRWLGALVLLFAVGLMPLGVAYAQDYEAVEKRLREAVSAGELTKDQARAMMDALRRSTQKEDRAEHGDRHISKEEYARAEKEIKALVKAGKVSEADAKKRLGEMKRMMKGSAERGEHRITREEYARAEKEIKALVKAGKVSEKDAKTRLGEMKRVIAEQARRDEDAYWERVKKRIEGAVESGQMTREEANAKYKELKKERRERGKGERDVDRREEVRALRARYAEAEAHIRAAVEAGDLTEEEAEKKLIQLREDMFGDR